jgi:hypothetical protein
VAIFGKSLSEYAEFSWVFLVLIALAGITRLALSLNGAPNSRIWWVSMTILMWIAVVYYPLRVLATGFGSYKQLLGIFILLNVVTQVISIGAILIAITSGKDNIFSVPEYAFGSDNKWLHVLLHASVGMIVGSLMPWLIGSGILALTRKLAPQTVTANRRTP